MATDVKKLAQETFARLDAGRVPGPPIRYAFGDQAYGTWQAAAAAARAAGAPSYGGVVFAPGAPGAPSAPRAPGATPYGVAPSGMRGSEAWVRYLYDVSRPELAAQQALREAGISPTVANPFTRFLQAELASSIPLFVLQNALTGGAGSSQELRTWLGQVLQQGGMPQVDWPGLFAQARDVLRRRMALEAGQMGTMLTPAELWLSEFVMDPSRAAALWALTRRAAPGLQSFLARAAENTLIPTWMALAPAYTRPTRSFLDFLTGSL